MRISLTDASATLRPVPTEPVKVMALTSGELMIASPTTEPLPMTRLSTPFGSPARARMSTISQEQPGTRSAGLNTTVLPWQSAGAIFHAGMAIGKFHGVMMPTTPTGSRVMVDLDAGPDARHDFAGQAQRFAGEEIEDLPCPHRLADAFGKRLALLARKQAAELLAPLQNLVAGRLEDVVALLDARARPRREGRLGGGNGALGVVGAAAGIVADDLVGVGRVDVGNGLAVHPVPIDIVAVQIVHDGRHPCVRFGVSVPAGASRF